MTDSDIHLVEKAGGATGPETPKTKTVRLTKADKLLKLLQSKRGATIAQLQEASGWRAHSVRGFLSGTVRKKLGLTLFSDTNNQGVRRYRIEKSGKAVE